MIDTIKLLIPIKDPALTERLKGTLERFRKENLKDGKISFEFHAANLKLGSHNRTVSIKATNAPAGFFVEFSVPKYAKGNNVEMLYPHDLMPALEKLYEDICNHMEYALPHISTWQVYALDVCYNWLFENAEQARYVMDFIQRIDYPRKKKYTFDTSVMHKGTAYTIKFYLKGPEFLKHDFKELPYERSTILQSWANRIVRFEIRLRREYLQEFLGLDKVYANDLTDDETIQHILHYYLTEKVFRYVNAQTMTSAAVLEILEAQFSKGKAARLFQFYRSYYFDTEMKQIYARGSFDRSTIYRYKKDLKKAGVGFDVQSDAAHASLLEQLIIPSPTTKFDLFEPITIVSI